MDDKEPSAAERTEHVTVSIEPEDQALLSAVNWGIGYRRGIRDALWIFVIAALWAAILFSLGDRR